LQQTTKELRQRYWAKQLHSQAWREVLDVSLLQNGLLYYTRSRDQEEVRLFLCCGGQVQPHIEQQSSRNNDSIVKQEVSPLPMAYQAKLVRKAMRETKFDLESLYDLSWSSATNKSKEREDEDLSFASTSENESKSNLSSNNKDSSNEEECNTSAHAYTPCNGMAGRLYTKWMDLRQQRKQNFRIFFQISFLIHLVFHPLLILFLGVLEFLSNSFDSIVVPKSF
jgi:hypothetical protein